MWKKPVVGEIFGKSYQFSRANSRPGKRFRLRRVYRAPTREIDQAAAVEGGEGGIDFKRVRGVYDRLSVFGNEFFAEIRTKTGRLDGVRERLELVVRRQKILRRLARKKVRGAEITDSDRFKADSVLRNPFAGLAHLRSPLRLEAFRFEADNEKRLDEQLEAAMAHQGLTWSDQLGEGKISLSDVNPLSSFSSFWKVTGLAPDLVCYKFLMKYSKERLDLEKDEELHLEAVAAQIGISCKGVLKRLEEGLARLKRRDEKLAQQLKQYLRDRRALPPDAQKHENEQSEALERESQGSRRRWAEW